MSIAIFCKGFFFKLFCSWHEKEGLEMSQRPQVRRKKKNLNRHLRLNENRNRMIGKVDFSKH